MSPVSLKLIATSEPVEPGVTTSSTAKPASGVKRPSRGGASSAAAAPMRQRQNQDRKAAGREHQPKPFHGANAST